MSPLEQVCDVNPSSAISVLIYTQTGPKRRMKERWTEEIIFSVVRRNLLPTRIIHSYIHPTVFKNPYLFRINILQEFTNVFQTPLKCAQTICKNFTLQDSYVPELNTRPVSILLTVQHSSVFILSKYISAMGSRHQDSLCVLRKPTAEREETELEPLQHQEPNESLQDNDRESNASEGQQDQWETPSKKIKVTLDAEDTTTRGDNSVQRFCTVKSETITASKDTSTFWDNRVRQAEHETDHDTYRLTSSNDKDQVDVVNEVSDFESFCGLRNQGSTCYLNAVLQTLFMTKDFRSAVMELKGPKTKSVSAELQKLFRCLGSKKGSVTTKGITKALEIKNVCEQQDAAEYFQKILSMTEPEPSKIFQGTKKHSTTCQGTLNPHEYKEEIISFFSLAIPMESDQNDVINVENNLNAQFDDTFMEGEDQLYCECCETKTDMKMSCTIVKLPEVLTLHMQRFYFDYDFMTYRKNNCRVKIPLQLRVKVKHYCYDVEQQENRDMDPDEALGALLRKPIRDNEQGTEEEGSVFMNYELYAIVNHVGSLHGGHYYAEIKSSEDQWYEFNDSMVQRIPDFCLVKCPQNHITSDTACLLCFTKSNAQQVNNVKKFMTLDKSESPQNIKINIESPEDSCIEAFEQKADHVNISIDQHTERDFQQELQDQKPESKENPSQERTDISTAEVQSVESKPNTVSFTAEAFQPSGMFLSMSDISHQKIKENRASGTTETTCPETSELHIQRANSWPKDLSKFLQRHIEQDHFHNKINIESPEDSSCIEAFKQKADHVNISIDQHTERDFQQELQDQKPETKENPSQERTDISTAEVQSVDDNHDNHSKSNVDDNLTAEQSNGLLRQEGDICESDLENENNEVPGVDLSLLTNKTCPSTQKKELVSRMFVYDKTECIIIAVVVVVVVAVAAVIIAVVVMM